MIKALFYKEWIKTKFIVVFLAAVYAAVLAYICIDVVQMFNINGAMRIWSYYMSNEQSIVSNLRWIPLLVGLVLAAAQFVPEMIEKRYKLTLHLPLKEDTILFSTLGFGLIVQCLFALLSLLVIFVCLSIFLAPEFVVVNVITALPWLLGGFAAYLIAAAIIIEPSWKRRLILAVVAYYIITLFYAAALPGAFLPALLPLAFFVLAMTALPFNSTIRFKDSDEK